MRELDKWLAENIMGWTLRKVEHSNDKELEGIPCWCKGAHILSTDARWRPTESISDAFQVVKKIMMNGYMFALGGERDWSATFHGEKSSFYCDARTAPLAICLAAKKTIEMEEK